MEFVKFRLHVLKNTIKKIINAQDVPNHVSFVHSLVTVSDVMKDLKSLRTNWVRLIAEIFVEMEDIFKFFVMMEILKMVMDVIKVVKYSKGGSVLFPSEDKGHSVSKFKCKES